MKKFSYGQVFLKDKRYIDKIINSADIKEKVVCEIGAGRGDLTQYLLDKAGYLYAIELDKNLCNFLKNRFSRRDKIEIIHSNILNFSFSHLKKKIVVIGNIPYYISKRIIEHLIKHRKVIKAVYLTVQKEFAQKLIAKPSTEYYCFLSIYIQYYAKVKKIFNIPKRAFSPIPKVNSSFISIEFYPAPIYKVNDEQTFFKTIHKAFSQRRKKIINSLPLNEYKRTLVSALIDSNARAEDISLKEYVSLVNL